MPIEFCLLFFGQPGPDSAQLGILAVPSGFAARGGSGSSLGGEVREGSRHRGLRSLAPAPRPRRTSRASLRPRAAPAAPRRHAGAAGRRDGAAGQRRRSPRGLRARGGECGAAGQGVRSGAGPGRGGGAGLHPAFPGVKGDAGCCCGSSEDSDCRGTARVFESGLEFG